MAPIELTFIWPAFSGKRKLETKILFAPKSLGFKAIKSAFA